MKTTYLITALIFATTSLVTPLYSASATTAEPTHKPNFYRRHENKIKCIAYVAGLAVAALAGGVIMNSVNRDYYSGAMPLEYDRGYTQSSSDAQQAAEKSTIASTTVEVPARGFLGRRASTSEAWAQSTTPVSPNNFRFSLDCPQPYAQHQSHLMHLEVSTERTRGTQYIVYENHTPYPVLVELTTRLVPTSPAGAAATAAR